MANIPTQKKILTENFPEKERKWIPALLEPLNKFMEEVTNALNGRLTLTQNIAGDLVTVIIDGNWPKKSKWTKNNRPRAVIIGQHREISENHVAQADPLCLDWEFKDGFIQINNVINSLASTSDKFNLTLVIFAE